MDTKAKHPNLYSYDEAIRAARDWIGVVSVGSLAGPIASRFGVDPATVCADIKKENAA